MPTAAGADGSAEGGGSDASLAHLAGVAQPLLLDVARFLCDTPADLTSMCCASTQLAKLLQSGPISRAVWRELYGN
ncbi:unnamed protein product, partial [Prorocentrum cordatum]